MLNTHKPRTAALLFACARTMGLHPEWIVPGGLLAITANGSEQYINLARSPLNSDLSASLAKDKYLTRLILQRHGMPNIPFIQAQTLEAAQTFLATYKVIVAKPVQGAGACDIHIITRPEQLDGLAITNYILEQYIVGKELRYLVLNDAVIAVHESEYGTSVAPDRALKRISYPKDTWEANLMATSLQIADVLGLRFAAVDYLIDGAGNYLVLEVNTMPGLKWFHNPTTGPRVDVARLLLEAAYVAGPLSAPAH